MNKLKVGSKLVEKGRVYKVYKIEKRKVGDKVERIIHYRPFFKMVYQGTISCSIPERNIDEANIRNLITKTEVNKILKKLSKHQRKLITLDVVKTRTIINSNNIHQIAIILKRGWKEKKVKGDDFSKTKKDILKVAITKMVEEIAVVSRVSLTTAEQKITSALDASSTRSYEAKTL